MNDNFQIIIKLLFILTCFKSTFSQLDGSFWWLQTSKTDNTGPSIFPSTAASVSDAPTSSNARLKKEAPVCCECVPFFLCKDGKIITDGQDLINTRIGGQVTTPAPATDVEVCPNELDVCCLTPDAVPECLNASQSQVTENPDDYLFTPHPMSNCECISYNECEPSLVVSDGLGKTSMELSNGRVVNNSKCLHALDVCCFIPDFMIGNDTDILISPSLPTPVMPTDKPEPVCECVPSSLCGFDGFIKTDGEGLLDLRIGQSQQQQPKPCPTNPNLVCCFLHEDGATSVPRIPPTPTTHPVPQVLHPCGQRNVNGIGVRIMGFKEGQTQFGEFPWVTTLLKREIIDGKEYPLFLGGASLIHRRVVLTAAHKIKGTAVEKLVIRLGEYDAASNKESLPSQDVGVEKVILHPSYTPGPLFHDVALIILKEDANQQYHISPICLAKSLDEVDHSSCVINGWGVDAYNSENYQKIMKGVELPLIGRSKCQEYLRKTRLSKYFLLHHSFICAGGEEDKDACKGDGGGPLACAMKADPSRYLQVGITAWGIGCGGKDIPGVYVDIPVHYKWIMNHVNELFLDDKQHSPTEATILTSSHGPLSKREQRRQNRREERIREREERRRLRKEDWRF